MRRILAYFVLPALVFGPACMAAELSDYTSSNPTPPLELEDLNGRPHSLEDYRGKVLLVNFRASWCHPCLQEIPELINLDKELADQPFAILAVNVGEEKRKLPGFTKRMAEHMVMLMDPDSVAFKEWEGIGLPSSFVLDPAGRIRYEAYGPVNWDAGYIVRSFRELMVENPAAADSRDQDE